MKRQLIGAFSTSWLTPMVEVLSTLGSERLWAVCGADGNGRDHHDRADACRRTEGRQSIAVHDFAVRCRDWTWSTPDALRGGDPEHNALALRAVLEGEKTPYRDIAVFNAAGALLVADAASSLQEGMALATEALDSGKVKATLATLASVSHAE